MWTGSESAPRSVTVPFVPTSDTVEVRRSRRRTRTVTAWREGGVTVVAIPARFTRAQEREWVDKMLGRLATQDQRRRPSDEALLRRAKELSRAYLGGRAVPASVAWSSRQGKRWGSCTTVDRSIRISDRLQGMPTWVLDYVLVHELAHLLHAGHGPRFWEQVAAYPQAERARGFLDGYAHASARGGAGDEGWSADEAGDDVGDEHDADERVEATGAEPDGAAGDERHDEVAADEVARTGVSGPVSALPPGYLF